MFQVYLKMILVKLYRPSYATPKTIPIRIIVIVRIILASGTDVDNSTNLDDNDVNA